ncbi:MAG: magnesium transporter [Staphylothermus sp.]|nr:magnesium transporter [Staphylothermus sp.]
MNEEKQYTIVSTKAIKQQIFSITIQSLGGFVSTFIFGIYRFFLMKHPWILAINPPMKDLHGNIYSSLLSRLNSGLHIGLIKPSMKDRVVLSNVLIVLFTQMLSGILIIFITWLIIGGDLLFIFETVIPAIALISLLMYPFTSYFSLYSYKKGYDPESLLLPVIMMIADIVTTPVIVGYSLIIETIMSFLRHFLFIVVLAFIVLIMILAFRLRTTKTFRIIHESQLILTACALFDIGAGTVFAYNINLLVSYPFILLTAPVFNAISGSIASIYAVRQNVLYHLGLTSLKPSIEKLKYMPYMYLVMLYGAVLIGSIGYALSMIISKELLLPLWLGILIVIVAGTISVPILWILIQLLAYLSFKIGFDPDNVMVPLLTSIVDFLGSLIYIGIAQLIIS